MGFKLIQDDGNQKISQLEKELKNLQEALKSTSIALGTKLLNTSAKSKNDTFVTEGLLTTWLNDVQKRKEQTEAILKIKNELARKEQLKALNTEITKLINTKEKNIQKLKKTFVLLVYENHRDEFTEAIKRVPEVSLLEEKIEKEKAKIEGLDGENEGENFFDKIMPSVKSFFSKTKVSSTEGKLKKVLQKNLGEIFSDDDFDSLCEMVDELPEDLAEVIRSLKKDKETKNIASVKLSELKNDAMANDKKLESLDALNNSKKQISNLMQEIKILDSKIEDTAIVSCENYLASFFDADGEPLSKEELSVKYTQQLKEIGELKRKCFNAGLNIDIAKCEKEIAELENKLKANLNKIERNKKQIENLSTEIKIAENANVDFRSTISDYETEIVSIQERLKNI